ncbi:MAG: hypothetical protein OK452_08275 [Thaumarchaeota archaeon]|nr:hypothetical protein [Nitrososphaerota archaeon]
MRRIGSRNDLTAIYEMCDAYWSIFLSVQRALGMLGESGKEATLRYLEDSGLRLEEVPLRPDQFVECLREIFGLGAVIIEGEIEDSLRLMENLSKRRSSLVGAVLEIKERKTLQ